MINIDNSLYSSDWIKMTGWGFPGVNSLKDLLGTLGLSESDIDTQKKKINAFMKLPAAVPMPDSLRKEVYEFLGASLPNPQFAERILWCLDTVKKFFPNEWKNLKPVFDKILKNKIRFFEDLEFEDQMAILEIETREIPSKWHPKSYLEKQLMRASKSVKSKTDTIG
jgi:hypothetical protein